MKAKSLRVMMLEPGKASTKRVHVLKPGFFESYTDVAHDVVVLATARPTVEDVRGIRQEMPGIPIVLVTDGMHDLGEERICTSYAPLVVVIDERTPAPYERLMPALYAAVPASIEP